MPEEEERFAGREVTRYGMRVVYTHWAVMVVFISLSLTALLLFRDWFYNEFNVFGADPLVPTPDWLGPMHVLLGVLLLILGLAHVLMHIGQEDKPILPKDVAKDFQASVQTLRYVFFLSNWDEKGGVHKYRGNQRISYVATFYTIALASVTALMVSMGLWGDVGVLLHVVTGLLVVMFAVFRMVYLLKKRDWIAWRSVLLNGRMPLWFVKVNHPKWFEELVGPEEAVPSEGPDGPVGPEGTTVEEHRPGKEPEASGTDAI